MGEQLRWSPKLYHLFCTSSSCGEHRPSHGIANSNNKSYIQTTTLILTIVTSALHIFFLTRQEDVSFRRVLGKSVGSAIVFCLSIAVVWPVAALLMYHMRVCPLLWFYAGRYVTTRLSVLSFGLPIFSFRRSP